MKAQVPWSAKGLDLDLNSLVGQRGDVLGGLGIKVLSSFVFFVWNGVDVVIRIFVNF
jgi:hypothetical protein